MWPVPTTIAVGLPLLDLRPNLRNPTLQLRISSNLASPPGLIFPGIVCNFPAPSGLSIAFFPRRAQSIE